MWTLHLHGFLTLAYDNFHNYMPFFVKRLFGATQDTDLKCITTLRGKDSGRHLRLLVQTHGTRPQKSDRLKNPLFPSTVTWVVNQSQIGWRLRTAFQIGTHDTARGAFKGAFNLFPWHLSVDLSPSPRDLVQYLHLKS